MYERTIHIPQLWKISRRVDTPQHRPRRRGPDPAFTRHVPALVHLRSHHHRVLPLRPGTSFFAVLTGFMLHELAHKGVRSVTGLGGVPRLSLGWPSRK
jgi:hypothetical protein